MKSYSIHSRFGIHAAALALPAILLLTGCEGESRKRSTANNNLPDSSAVRKEEAPKPSSPATTNPQVGNTNSSEPTQSDPSTIAATPVDPAAKLSTPKIDITKPDKLEEVRQKINYHSAMVLPSEVSVVANAGASDHINLIYNTESRLELDRLKKAMDAYKALNNGKVPKDVVAFIKFLRDDENRIYLPELKPDQFYIYDPEAAKLEKSKENLDYLKVYEP
jgi:hypothetical protein